MISRSSKRHKFRMLEPQRPNMRPEDIVVEEVVRYFSTPKFERVSIKTEYPIQMGTDNRRADVVLIDRDGKLAAIAECKKIGYEGSGLDQLKSYLSATDTPLGAFANSKEPDSWTFIENLGRNQFKPIDRSQFEARVLKTGIIKALNNFVRRIFPGRSGGTSQNKSHTLSVRPPHPEPSTPSVSPPQPQSRIAYTGGDQPLQNDNNTDSDPSLNDKPYYSEQNGFYWAANHHGIAECVPQHVKRIIHNEELEIKSSPAQIQAEIDRLMDKKNGLEEQKREREQAIGQSAQELAQKKEELAGLEVQLEAITETELDLPPIEEPHHDAAKQQLEGEISQLHEEKDRLEREIGQKSQELARKKEELAGLEVELETPTQAELNPTSTDVSAKQRFSYSITGIIATIFLLPLMVYLFIFYASVVDKAFFLNIESLKEKSQGILNALDIVNPTAFLDAFRSPGNPVVILFPSIFIAFAIVTHHFWEQRKWLLLGVILLVTLLFDGILAIQISQKIDEVRELAGLIPETNYLNMFTVIFCGFVVSLLASILYHVK